MGGRAGNFDFVDDRDLTSLSEVELETTLAETFKDLSTESLRFLEKETTSVETGTVTLTNINDAGYLSR
jgi:hypothetical protein